MLLGQHSLSTEFRTSRRILLYNEFKCNTLLWPVLWWDQLERRDASIVWIYCHALSVCCPTGYHNILLLENTGKGPQGYDHPKCWVLSEFNQFAESGRNEEVGCFNPAILWLFKFIFVRKKRVNYILIAMVAAFIICWFPLTAVNLLRDFRKSPECLPPDSRPISKRFHTLNDRLGREPNFLKTQPYLWSLLANSIAVSFFFIYLFNNNNPRCLSSSGIHCSSSGWQGSRNEATWGVSSTQAKF